MNNPKISFVIPTLNEEKILEKTLLSLKKYTGDHEVIVSDGGSKDRTLEIARANGALVAPHTGTERQTIAAGRNAGAKLASGDFLVFIDADVFILDIDNFFDKAFKNFERNKKLVALTVGFKILPENETLSDMIVFKMLSLSFYVSNNFFHVGVSGGEFQMIKKETFNMLHGFNEKLVAAEDGDMFSRLSMVGKTRCDLSLSIYHTGRREHEIGWPRLIFQWMRNYIWAGFTGRAWSKVWEEVR